MATSSLGQPRPIGRYILAGPAKQPGLTSHTRRGWSPATHAEFPPRVRAAACALLLCARRASCPLAKLPAEILLKLISTLVARTYWE